MTVSEAERLKALEDENAKLKRLLAEQMPGTAVGDLISEHFALGHRAAVSWSG